MISHALDHVSFCVPDLDAAMHFYQDILGCETIDRPDFGFAGAWLQAGNVQIHLIVPPDGFPGLGSNPEKTTPIWNHTAFAIDDYEKVLAHLQSHDLEVLETNPEQGQMWVSDPAGNVIELISSSR